MMFKQYPDVFRYNTEKNKEYRHVLIPFSSHLCDNVVNPTYM